MIQTIERPMTIEQRKVIVREFAQGRITQEQAMKRLNIESSEQFYSVLERLPVQEWQAMRRPERKPSVHVPLDATVSEGYVNFWLSSNYELED